MYVILEITPKLDRKVARIWSYLEPSPTSTVYVNSVRDRLAAERPAHTFVALHTAAPEAGTNREGLTWEEWCGAAAISAGHTPSPLEAQRWRQDWLAGVDPTDMGQAGGAS